MNVRWTMTMTMAALLLATTWVSASVSADEPMRRNDGVVEGNVFRNERLNLRAEIPPGYGVHQTRGGDQVSIGHEGSRDGVSVSFIRAASSYDVATSYLLLMESSFIDMQKDGVKHVDHPRQEVTTPLGHGVSRSWDLIKPGRTATVRYMMLSVCDDNAVFSFIEDSDSPTSRALLDGFIASFTRIDPSRPAGACQGLPMQ